MSKAPACAAMQAAAQDEGLDLRPTDRAARAWLATVDSGRYGDSWEDAAALFKETIPKLRWETTVQSVREPLGVVVGRKVRSMTYARILPNAPEGEYVVIQFDTRFENRRLGQTPDGYEAPQLRMVTEWGETLQAKRLGAPPGMTPEGGWNGAPYLSPEDGTNGDAREAK